MMHEDLQGRGELLQDEEEERCRAAKSEATPRKRQERMETSLQYELFYREDLEEEEEMVDMDGEGQNPARRPSGDEGVVVVFRRSPDAEGYAHGLEMLRRGCERIGLVVFDWAEYVEQMNMREGEVPLLGPPECITSVIPRDDLECFLEVCGKDIRVSQALQRLSTLIMLLLYCLFLIVLLIEQVTRAWFLVLVALAPGVFHVMLSAGIEYIAAKHEDRPFEFSCWGPVKRFRDRIEHRVEALNKKYQGQLVVTYEYAWLQLVTTGLELIVIRLPQDLEHGTAVHSSRMENQQPKLPLPSTLDF